MNGFYTFVVTSSLNTTSGRYSIEQRLVQTLETFTSIRKKVSNACIIFVDTENPPITQNQKNIIKSWVDYYIEHDSGLLEKVGYAHFDVLAKSIGEYSLYHRAFNFIIKNNLQGRRIFKISGRYRLADSFNIDHYNDLVFRGKYTFRHKIMYIQQTAHDGGQQFAKDFLETRLWSLCPELLDKFTNKLPDMLAYTIKNKSGIEIAMWDLLERDQVFIVPLIHLEGNIAENGDYILD